MFKDKVAIITGGAQGIGKCVADEFRKAGAHVYVIDIQEGPHYIGDLSKKDVLESFAAYVLERHQNGDYIINNALPTRRGIADCTHEGFEYARARMSQPQSESYTAAKGGIEALTHALAVSLAGKARVNSISPGWIDTSYTLYEGPDANQQPAGRGGNPMDIANMIMFLCSDKSGFITGENICIDGGMTRHMIYHGDHGWKLDK